MARPQIRMAAARKGVTERGQIAALEQRLGTRLFDRDTRNVETTAAGRAFLEVAKRMVNMAEEGMADFQAYLAARRGRLTIAGLPSVTAGLVPALLKSFSVRHPNIDLRVTDSLSGSVLKAVESGEADIGFTAGTVSARSRLSFHRLLDDEFVAIGRDDGPLAADRPYAWAELLELPFVAMAAGTSVRELLDGACARLNQSLNPRFEVTHLATAGALVAEGLGITALPTLTLPILRFENLVFRPIPDFGAKRRVGLVWRSGHSLSPAAQAFLSHIRSTTDR